MLCRKPLWVSGRTTNVLVHITSKGSIPEQNCWYTIRFVISQSFSKLSFYYPFVFCRKCALISAHYNQSDVFDNLVISLCKFTSLLTSEVSYSSCICLKGKGQTSQILLLSRERRLSYPPPLLLPLVPSRNLTLQVTVKSCCSSPHSPAPVHSGSYSGRWVPCEGTHLGSNSIKKLQVVFWVLFFYNCRACM